MHLVLDRQGNPRTVAVPVKPGLIVWHSPQEYENLTGGVICIECGEPVREHDPKCSIPCQEGC
jgi:hypothetical protein